jgi:hypothetical protein
MEMKGAQLVNRQIHSGIVNVNSTNNYLPGLTLDISKHCSYSTLITPATAGIKYKIEASNDNVNWREIKTEATVLVNVTEIIKADSLSNFIRVSIKNNVTDTPAVVEFQARLNPGNLIFS